MEAQELRALHQTVADLKTLVARMETALAGDTLSPVGIIMRVKQLEDITRSHSRTKWLITGAVSAFSSATVSAMLIWALSGTPITPATKENSNQSSTNHQHQTK